MKRQIRRGVFETNSSSTHSLTLCSGEEYDRWKNGEILYSKWDNCFVGTKEECIKNLKKETWANGSLRYEDVDWDNEDQVYDIFSDNGICTYNAFWDDYEYEYFQESYKTPSGDIVIAFGYYGYDC